MSVKPIPDGCERIIPHITVKGASKAIEFYKKAFGATVRHEMKHPDGRIMHADLRVGDSVIYLNDDFPEMCGGKERNPQALGGTPCTLHFYVKDTDAAVKKAKDAGATVTMEPEDMFWGDRYGTVQDPFGHTWSFATRVKDMSPEEMAEASKAAFG